MLFDSGTTSLLTQTRLYAGDPDSAPRTTWTEAEVKSAINQRYLELRDLARIQDVGWARKVNYVTTVASQILYSSPTDMVALVRAEIDTSGADLSTLSTISTNSNSLAIESGDVALGRYHANELTECTYIFVHDSIANTTPFVKQLGVVAPPETGGSNSLRLLYDAETTELTNDTDAPVLPAAYHPLIAMGAAILLKISRDKDARDLQQMEDRRMLAFLATVHETSRDYHGQIGVSGLPADQDSDINMGSIG